LKISFVENAKSEQEEGNKFSKKRKRKGLTGGKISSSAYDDINLYLVVGGWFTNSIMLLL